MGQNKLILKYRNLYLIEHIILAIKKSNCFSKIKIVARGKVLEDIAKKHNIEFIKNENAEKGQSESIKLGVKSLENSNSRAIMFFVADQPFLKSKQILKLVKIFEENQNKIIVPRVSGKRGNPVIFPKDISKELLDLEGDIGGKFIIKKHEEKVIEVVMEDDIAFKDIDTIEQYNDLIKGEI